MYLLHIHIYIYIFKVSAENRLGHLWIPFSVATSLRDTAVACGAVLPPFWSYGHHQQVAIIAGEPSWRRNLRRKRSRARNWLGSLREPTAGARRRKSIRQKLGCLQLHHSWDEKVFPAVVRKVIAMSWWCQTCNIQNSNRVQECRSCGQHWTQTWTASKRKQRKRSRSQSAKKMEKNKNKDKEKKSKDQGNLSVFPESVPWIATTPQSRLPNPKPEVM